MSEAGLRMTVDLLIDEHGLDGAETVLVDRLNDDPENEDRVLQAISIVRQRQESEVAADV